MGYAAETNATNQTDLGAVFERASMRVECGTPVPLGGLLAPAGPLRRCQLIELPRGRDDDGTRLGDGWMLRLRIRGDALRGDGIRDGDYLVLDTRVGDLREGQTVLAEEAGCTVVRRVVCAAVGDAGRLRRLSLEALGTTADGTLPLMRGGSSARIYGAVVGILRKEIRQPQPARASRSGADDETRPARAARAGNSARVRRDGPPPSAPVRRLRALQHSLYALKSTYRATRHPRLRRALRDEAALLNREMARERERLGTDVKEVFLLN